MNLLTNAIDAIKVGVEDFRDGSQRRLKAAIRNIYAGLLLVYKDALRRNSPPRSNEVLIKARVDYRKVSSGYVIAIGKGEKTVNVNQIRERFTALGIKTDWTRFERIQHVRNNIEHYYSTLDVSALEGVIADAFVILNEFITRELHKDTRVLLGEKTWKEMLAVAEVYKVEREECDAAIGTIDWESPTLIESVASLNCTQCGSGLLVPTPQHSSAQNVSLRCRGCGNEEPAEEAIPRAIKYGLSWERYLSFTDGNDLPFVPCPDCSIEAYVIAEESCAYCGHEADHTCGRCGSEIPPEELENSPLCGWCAHITSKDD